MNNIPLTLNELRVIEDINEKIDKLDTKEKSLISDGSHTFGELYEHRYALFIALCNTLAKEDRLYDTVKYGDNRPVYYRAWKAKKHEDGTMWDGWFIAGIGTEPGKTLTYHLPLSEWDYLNIPEV